MQGSHKIITPFKSWLHLSSDRTTLKVLIDINGWIVALRIKSLCRSALRFTFPRRSYENCNVESCGGVQSIEVRREGVRARVNRRAPLEMDSPVLRKRQNATLLITGVARALPPNIPAHFRRLSLTHVTGRREKRSGDASNETVITLRVHAWIC